MKKFLNFIIIFFSILVFGFLGLTISIFIATIRYGYDAGIIQEMHGLAPLIIYLICLFGLAIGLLVGFFIGKDYKIK